MERFSFGKAQEEALKMQEKIASGDARTYSKAERLIKEDADEVEKINHMDQHIEENHSLESTQEQIAATDRTTTRKKEDEIKIDTLREEIKNMGKEGASQEHLTPVRELKDLEESFMQFARALNAREGENLNPLIDRSHTSSFASHVEILDEVAARRELDTELLREAFSKISASLSRFGDVPRERAVRENPENLKKISFTIDNSMDTLKQLYRTIPEAHDTEEARLAIKNLAGRLERINDFVMRKRSAFERFSGR